MTATTTTTDYDVPAELRDAYDAAATSQEVRAVVGAYYLHDPAATADGAERVAHETRLAIAAQRAEAMAKGRAWSEAIRAASLCNTGCGALRTYRAADGLCVRCHRTVAAILADDAGRDVLDNGDTRRERVAVYLKEHPR